MRYIHFFPLLLFVVFCVNSCSESTKNKEKKESIDPDASLNTNFDGKIFSIPSPVQTAMLIKDLNLPYNPSLPNDISNAANYSTEFQQALNLGIYGTDLGYCSLYEQKNAALKYLSVIEKITGELGLEGAFDKSFLSRFEKNAANNDSLMVIVSDAFRKADYFLKNAKRKSTSALILAGGWIESMYLASNMVNVKKSTKIIERIGEQQLTLETMIEILSEYNKKETNSPLIDKLKDLKTSFDQISIEYKYVKPSTDAKNKITTFQHEMIVKVSDKTISEITEKVKSIRESIIR